MKFLLTQRYKNALHKLNGVLFYTLTAKATSAEQYKFAGRQLFLYFYVNQIVNTDIGRCIDAVHAGVARLKKYTEFI